MPVPDFVLALRRHIGHGELWMPGVTAVIERDRAGVRELLLVRRADDGQWTPVTGIVDPGEEPATAARREAEEEAAVSIRVDRLASVSVIPTVTYANGDRATYLDHTFACTWLDGDPYPADGECAETRWFTLDALPTMSTTMTARIEAALSDEAAARFRS